MLIYTWQGASSCATVSLNAASSAGSHAAGSDEPAELWLLSVTLAGLPGPCGSAAVVSSDELPSSSPALLHGTALER